MRRLILLVLLALIAAAVLGACGGSNDSGGAATAPSTPASSASGSAAGAAVWAANCSRCHGEQPIQVPKDDAAQARSVIENGTGGMPAFAGKLSAKEIDAVTAYVAGGAQ